MSRHRALGQVGFFLLLAVVFLGASILCVGSREIPVLMYHFVNIKEAAEKDPLVVSTETFETQLQLLTSWGYRVYSLDEYRQIKSNKANWMGRGVVLTFDDGNRDFAERILPILEKYRAPAANFLVWNNLQKGKMGSMSLKQARLLVKHPLVTFGAHSMSHRELVGLSERELEEEIVRSKERLEGTLKIPIRYFSYPGGYFDERTLLKVKDASYRLAFTTSRKRLACRESDLFSIPRLKVTEKDAKPVRFWLKASGIQTVFEQVKFWMVCHVVKLR